MADELMTGFGNKQAWLAIRTDAPVEPKALGLRDLGDVSWRDGIDLAYLTDDRVAVTPPLPGALGARWVLAVGRRFMVPDFDLIGLSAELHTEVQFFATHRVSELHRWQRAADGELIRAFGYVGETGEVTSWFGEPGPAERDAGLPATFDDETTVLVGENDVLKVAAAWSIDPSTLAGRPAPGPLRLGATS